MPHLLQKDSPASKKHLLKSFQHIYRVTVCFAKLSTPHVAFVITKEFKCMYCQLRLASENIILLIFTSWEDITIANFRDEERNFESLNQGSLFSGQ